jgi:RNA 3'-terminal phosphate cyclase (ATP)
LLHIDGSMGEGGGQILRTALALSLCCHTPFRISRIRATRQRPGLQRQHLMAVQAAAAIGRAEVEGAELHSQQLSFTPTGVVAGDYRFDIGSAGSTTLVLQTILPALMLATAPSRLELVGGTHNPLAPPFDFLQSAFLPLLQRMGPQVAVELVRPGFYPKGGGLLRVAITPCRHLTPLHLAERGRLLRQHAVALLCHLPEHIAQRELQVVHDQLRIPREELRIAHDDRAYSPGNVVSLFLESEQLTEVVTGFGQRGVRAEEVASGLVREARRYLGCRAAVGEHLADQLLLPMALAGGGSFTTLQPSRHATTNMAVIERFTGLAFSHRQRDAATWQVHLA